MNQFDINPFGILTLIVAPAILTNASSIMALGTSNRFARAIDRARQLTAEIEAAKNPSDAKFARIVTRLRYTERRSRLLVRALTAFYLSVGSFAAASLVSLLGAVFVVAQHDTARDITQGIALGAGCLGVIGLVAGSTLAVLDTRLALHILHEQANDMIRICESAESRPAD